VSNKTRSQGITHFQKLENVVPATQLLNLETQPDKSEVCKTAIPVCEILHFIVFVDGLKRLKIVYIVLIIQYR
jgi:hypothetical protein